jgi:hypothetical protein
MRMLFAVVLLAGCTPMQWVRDGTSPEPEAFEKDSTFCRQQAWREAQYRAWAYRPVAPIVTRDPFGRRFVGWPYSPYAYPFGDPFFDEARLTDFCMRAKGYELVPVEKAEPAAQKPPA